MLYIYPPLYRCAGLQRIFGPHDSLYSIALAYNSKYADQRVATPYRILLSLPS